MLVVRVGSACWWTHSGSFSPALIARLVIRTREEPTVSAVMIRIDRRGAIVVWDVLWDVLPQRLKCLLGANRLGRFLPGANRPKRFLFAAVAQSEG